MIARTVGRRLRSLDDRAAELWDRRVTAWRGRPSTAGRGLSGLDRRVLPWFDRVGPGVLAASLCFGYLIIAIPIGVAYHHLGAALVGVAPFAIFPLLSYAMRQKDRH